MVAEYFVVRSFDSTLLAIPLVDVSGTLAVELSDVCPLPGVDPALLGVINQRGQLLWVLNLSEALGRGAMSGRRSPQSLTLLDLVRSHSQAQSAAERSRVACAVAELVEIVAFEDATIAPAPDELLTRLGYSERGRSLLSGTTDYQGETAVVLDADALFDALKQSSSSRSLVYS
ncbi:MAG: chemotaxis protein CheW [Cyanobacteria bacterium J06648_11]